MSFMTRSWTDVQLTEAVEYLKDLSNKPINGERIKKEMAYAG